MVQTLLITGADIELEKKEEALRKFLLDVTGLLVKISRSLPFDPTESQAISKLSALSEESRVKVS